MRTRLIGGVAAAAAILLLTAGTTLAGGWATITPDEGATVEPKAGQTETFGFTVLQHGVTPAGFEKPVVVVENIATGQRLSAPATGQGKDGHFVASITFPAAGYWTWRVQLMDLLVETPPRTITVFTASGAMPAFDPSSALAMVERVKGEMRAEFGETYGSRMDAYEQTVLRQRGEILALEAQVDQSQKNAVAGQGGGVPLPATIAIGALAGAIAGLAVVGLGRRSGRPTAPGAVPATELAPAGR